MKELVRTNDLVLLSRLQAAFDADGIRIVLLDQYTSALEGSIGALPRRVMVEDGDYVRARHILDSLEQPPRAL